jgi:integrase
VPVVDQPNDLGTILGEDRPVRRTWDRVDLASGMLRVDRQLQRMDGKNQLVDLKTAQSVRTLPMPDSIANTLRRHRRDQVLQRELAAYRWQETGLVFTTETGTGLEGADVTRRFQRLLLSAGLKRRRFHDLRHSCATLLLVQNVPPRVVMEILGHSQISLTMNTYSHVLPGLKRDAATSLDAILRQRGDGGVPAPEPQRGRRAP